MLGDPRLPIIRIQKGLFRHDLVAVYGDRIIVGHRWFGLSLDEVDSTPGGEKSLLGKLSHARVIPLADVNRIEVAEPASVPFVIDRRWRFDLRTNRGGISFWVEKEANENLASCLESLCPGRVVPRRGAWRHVRRHHLALVAALVATCCSSIALLNWVASVRDRLPENLRDILLAAGIVSMLLSALALAALLILVIYLTLVRVACRLVGRSSPSKVRAKSSPHPRTDLSRRRPFRSPALGWTLKISALLLWNVALFTQGLLVTLYPRALQDHLPGELTGWLSTLPGPPELWSGGLVGLIAGIPIVTPSVILLYWGYRLGKREYRWDQESGDLPPVVFLRSFQDDNRANLQPSSHLARFSGLVHPWTMSTRRTRKSPLDYALHIYPARLARLFLNLGSDTAEEVLALYLRRFGPTVAIGRPGEAVASPGFERLYVPEESWQDEVRRLLKACQMVVIQPGSTEGIIWEVAETFRLVAPNRVLLCLVNFHGCPDDYDRFRHQFERATGRTLPPGIADLESVAFLYFDADFKARVQPLTYRSPLVWPYVGSAADLDYSLAPYIQSALADRSCDPRPLRRSRVQSGLAWVALPLSLGAISLGMLLAGGPGYVASIAYAVRRDANSRTAANAVPAAAKEADRRRLLEELARSRPSILTGRRIPYQIELRGPWKERFADKPDQVSDRAFILGANLAVVEVAAVEDSDDPGSLESVTEQRLRIGREKISKEARLAEKGSAAIDGENWLTYRIAMPVGPGREVIEVGQIYTGARGTFFVVGTVADSSAEIERYVADALRSFRFPGPLSLTVEEEARIRPILEATPLEYRGKAAPYSIRLRPVWRPSALKEASRVHEFQFASDEGRAAIDIFCSGDAEDLSDLGRIRIETSRKSHGEKALITLRSTREVQINGIAWKATHITIETSSETTHEHARGYSGPEGTVLVMATLKAGKPFELRLAEDAFGTLRLVPPSEPGQARPED